MRGFFIAPQKNKYYRCLCSLLVCVLSFSLILSPTAVQAQSVLNLPIPGTMIAPSPAFAPVLLKGMTIHPDDPLKFDFIIDSGNTDFTQDEIKKESERLVKYFLAAMTIPKDDLWVNLSPYEEDRIIPDKLGKTELGRDMLAQDYILKQLTASLMYPEDELGKKFWDRVYQRAEEEFGTSEIPVNTFNKVWILPETATVYEHEQTVYIVNARLKVMLDVDYIAAQHSQGMAGDVGATRRVARTDNDLSVSSQIIKEIIIPEIEREVNEGAHFAPLRQIYHSLILAKWYKETIKNSLLSRVYADKNLTDGIESQEKNVKDKIYAQYMEAYKKGVFNYIKEDRDRLSNEIIPRKYFSGGLKIGAGDIRRSSSPVIDSKTPKYRANVVVNPQKVENGRATTISRRAFLKGAAVIVGTLALGNGIDAIAQEVRYRGEREVRLMDLVIKFASDYTNTKIKESIRRLINDGVDVNARDSRGRTALMYASLDAEERTAIVKMLLKAGADVNARDNSGKTALMHAIDYGHFANKTVYKVFNRLKLRVGSTGAVVNMLLEAGANIHASDNYGRTAEDIVKERIRGRHPGSGMSIAPNGSAVHKPLLNLIQNYPKRRRRQILTRWIVGVVTVPVVIVSFIVWKKWNENREMADSLTAASRGGGEIRVKKLLKEGANINTKNTDGITALMAAAKIGDIEAAKTLIENGANVSIKSNEGWTALHVAAQNGHTKIIEVLLENGADVNFGVDYGGETVLMIAAYNGHAEAVVVLLKNGADVSIADTKFSRGVALDYAKGGEHDDIIEILEGVEKTFRVEAEKGTRKDAAETLFKDSFKTKSGGTALMAAVVEGRMDTVKRLFNNSADVKINEEKNGVTALMLAAIYGHTEIVEILMKNGADVNHANIDATTALMLAAMHGHVDIVEILFNKTDNSQYRRENAFMGAAEKGHVEIVKFFLTKGDYVNFRGHKGWTALLIAAKNGHTEIVEALLKKGADVNIQTSNSLARWMRAKEDGVTALYIAAENGHGDIVKALLEKGANVDIQTSNSLARWMRAKEDGATALYVAAKNGHVDIVEALLNKGANVNIKVNNGFSVLDVAKLEKHDDIVEIFKKAGTKEGKGSSPIQGESEKRLNFSKDDQSSSPISLEGLLNTPVGLVGALEEKGQVLSVKAGEIFDIGLGDASSPIVEFITEHPLLSIAGTGLAVGYGIAVARYFIDSLRYDYKTITVIGGATEEYLRSGGMKGYFDSDVKTLVKDGWEVVYKGWPTTSSNIGLPSYSVHRLRRRKNYNANTTSSPVTSEEVGGIDLNEIEVDRQGGLVDIQFDPLDVQAMIDMGITGFAPVIISITPLPSVLPLLGLAPQREEEEEFELSSLN